MSKHKTAQLLSPEKYIRTRARTLPLGTCYINAGWKQSGMAIIIVTRKHINENITFAVFQVDLFCLGIKAAMYYFNADPDLVSDLRKMHGEMSEPDNQINEADYTLVHNILYGAIEYAEDLGFYPPKEFDIAIHILEEDDEQIELIEIEFGLHGKPVVFFGKEAHPQNILAQLDKSVGKNNYSVFYGDDYDIKHQKITIPDEFDRVFEDEDNFNREDGYEDAGGNEDEDLDFIDKPLEEFTEADLQQVLTGEKYLTPANLFKFTFSTYYLGIKKKDKKEIDKIVDEIDRWNIREGTSENEEGFFKSDREREIYDKLYGKYRADPEKSVIPIQDAIAKYPGNFHLHNLLGMVYQALEWHDLLLNYGEALYQKFPSNVYAFSNLANLFIAEDKILQAEMMVDPRFNIHKQFPWQKEFSQQELLAFLSVVINYFLATDRPVKAAAYTMAISTYDWDSHHEVITNDLYLKVANAVNEYVTYEKSYD